MTYKTTVGIEVHAELKTKSKMFCGCKNDPHAAEPNTLICPVCLAHPGTLPTVNKEAVRKVLEVGVALNGELADYSEFDRKNYFYPDIPKAYQLSQLANPFVTGGELAGVKITRVHLEEDTARSLHDKGEGSIVDFNRAGVPLMELVTEPVIHDSKSAGDFTRELQLLLRTLGVSDANMERGEMRVEANISVSSTDELGTKVEVKNLNSFKAMEQAIDFEVKRHIAMIEKGEEISQETRGWDENRSKTFSQRSKETADDYRYFPDPDIPKFKLSEIEDFDKSRIEENMVELPDKIRLSLQEFEVKSEQIETLLADAGLLNFLKESIRFSCNSSRGVQLAANYLTSDISGLLQADEAGELKTANAEVFAALVSMVESGEITSRVAKDLLKEVVFEGADPKNIAKERGLLQTSSTDDILPVVKDLIANNPTVVEEYKAGKETAIKFLVGQGMKETKGSANPAILLQILQDELS